MADLYKVIPINKEIHILASSLRLKFSYWDSLIVATALDSNSEKLFTEDMQHGLQVEDKLEIINPFL
jgi:predicted nucleic acid-binding protein